MTAQPVGQRSGALPRVASIVAALTVAAVLVAGCRGGADPAAAGAGSYTGSGSSTGGPANGTDPIGSIEATIDAVEGGFAADSSAAR